jgi:DNA-binding transcriptional ArsR family regulator
MDQLTAIARALCCETRHYVLGLLGDGGLTVSEVARQAQLAPSTVCHHLAVLMSAGLAVRVRRGSKTLYKWSNRRWELVCRSPRRATPPATTGVQP